MRDQAGCLLEYLDSSDACVRALAARALGLLGERAAAQTLRSLLHDDSEVVLDGPDAPEITRVSIEAERALGLMENSQ
jgi:HEAT repeat protein